MEIEVDLIKIIMVIEVTVTQVAIISNQFFFVSGSYSEVL